MSIEERKLSYQARKKMPKGEFVFPKEKRYPIEDKPHARNALARVAQHGSSSEKAKVRAAVHSKYPDIGECQVPPLGPEERNELGESQFVCSIRGQYGHQKVTVNAVSKEDAIQVCMRQTGKRPSDVTEKTSDVAEPAPQRQHVTTHRATSEWEPGSFGPLTMKQ
jgi:hypothetical protein